MHAEYIVFLVMREAIGIPVATGPEPAHNRAHQGAGLTIRNLLRNIGQNLPHLHQDMVQNLLHLNQAAQKRTR